MIGYVTIGTKDLDRACKFYDGLLAVVGAHQQVPSAVDVGGHRGPAVVVAPRRADRTAAEEPSCGNVDQGPLVLAIDIEPGAEQVVAATDDFVAHHVTGGAVAARGANEQRPTAGFLGSQQIPRACGGRGQGQSSAKPIPT